MTLNHTSSSFPLEDGVPGALGGRQVVCPVLAVGVGDAVVEALLEGLAVCPRVDLGRRVLSRHHAGGPVHCVDKCQLMRKLIKV